MSATADDRDLQLRLQVIEARLHVLERMVVQAVGALALTGLALSVVLPFWTSSESSSSDESPHLWLVQAIFAPPAAGGGPFSGDAMVAGVLLGILLLATLFAFVAIAAFTFGRTPVRGWQRAALVLVSLGSGGAWLLTFLLSAHFERAGNLIGIGLIAHSVGCLLAWGALAAKSTFGRAPIRR